MSEEEIVLILNALKYYQDKLNKENLRLNNITLFARNIDIIGNIITIKEKLQNLNDYIPKSKVEEKINQFKIIRDEILKMEKDLKRPSITYDLIRNDYCEKLLQELLEENDNHIPHID